MSLLEVQYLAGWSCILLDVGIQPVPMLTSGFGTLVLHGFYCKSGANVFERLV